MGKEPALSPVEGAGSEGQPKTQYTLSRGEGPQTLPPPLRDTLTLIHRYPRMNNRGFLHMDYAIFKTGGKQYRVKPGDVLDVELLPLEVGDSAEFEEVLAVSDGGEVNFGSPHVAGARVVAQVQSHYKDRKLMVFKYKAKTRYRLKKGHRQNYTRLVIQDIQTGG